MEAKTTDKAKTEDAKKPATATSTAHPPRLTQQDVIDAIKRSKSKPLLVADGTAIQLSDQLRKFGTKQVSIVVLS